MKTSTILAVAATAAALISDGLAANYHDLVEQGYRWVNTDGPEGHRVFVVKPLQDTWNGMF
jgi:hypothetical protein